MKTKINFWEEILAAVGDDTIKKIAIDKFDTFIEERQLEIDQLQKDMPIGVPMDFEEAKQYLNYEHSMGYGTQDCNNVYIWGKKFTYYLHEYDGATWVQHVPAKPCKCFGG